NLTLPALMNSKQFRQDLFYRISVVPIVIPPLRERKEDVYPLIRHFIKQFNEKYGTNMQMPAKFMRRLLDYNWPGNVRELKNVMERVAILYASQEPSDEDFDFLLHIKSQGADISEMIPIVETKQGSPQIQNPEAASLKSATDKLEENLIRQAYKEAGSIVKAAKLLGINPSTIHRKLKKGIISLN
ncbi:MAG: helix-turn-helix domain-containing protein, partial [Syntrophales bacterium]|nr:helix-turn-helix domain-containing protein [Syntrophales bacterium]